MDGWLEETSVESLLFLELLVSVEVFNKGLCGRYKVCKLPTDCQVEVAGCLCLIREG